MLQIHKKDSHLFKYELLKERKKSLNDNMSRYYNYDLLKSPSISDSPWVETWERSEIPVTENDIYIEYQENENVRLDLLSYQYYKTSKLWWAIAIANNIQNMFIKLKRGTILRIPVRSSIKIGKE